jgi:hypothetical protein
MKKKLPVLKTDKEAEAFVATTDLSQYDLSDMRPLQYEFAPKAQARHHAPAGIAGRGRQERSGSYRDSLSAYIRQVLEAALHHRP